MTENELVEFLKVSLRTVRRWRHDGTGPRVVRVGKSPRYWRSDAVRWVEEASATTGGTAIPQGGRSGGG